MNFATHVAILLGFVLQITHAQDNLQVIGFGPDPGPFDDANEHPLNQTHLDFLGFNFEADPASTTNASTGQWTLNLGLSIVNTDTNQTNYPLAAATNATSNVLNVAYSLDFPGGQLPSPNDTDWTLCSYIVDVPWTQTVLNRASGDSGDCSTVLGASCLDKVRQGWQNPSNGGTSGCPRVPDFTSFSECNSISTNGYGAYSAAINSVRADLNNRSSPIVGLPSGQVYSWERSEPFNASTALMNYDEFASKLRMTVLTFAPSVEYNANHSGSNQIGEVRTFCSVFDKAVPKQNLGSRQRMSRNSPAVLGLPLLLLAWEALSMLCV